MSDASDRRKRIRLCASVLPDSTPRRWVFWRRSGYVYEYGIKIGEDSKFHEDRILLEYKDVVVGDILVCVGKAEFKAKRIQNATHGPFVHAAIVGPHNTVYEARTSGIGTRSVVEFVKDYDYVVVLCHHLLGRREKRKKLIDFLKNQQGGYSFASAFRSAMNGGISVVSRKSSLNRGLDVDKKSYICSGYVRRALHACDVWHWSSNAEITTPNDIANTPDFQVRGLISAQAHISIHVEDATTSLQNAGFRNRKRSNN